MEALPTEIVHHIVHYLSGDQRSLAAVHRSCKLLWQATLAELYREPHFRDLAHFTTFVEHIRPQAAQHVRKLDFSLVPHRWTRNTLGQSVLQLLEHAKYVTELDLNMCRIDRDTLIGILSKLQRPYYVSIGDNAAVNDQVVSCLRDVRKIDIRNTSISNTGLETIARQCPRLEWLDVSSCLGINESGVVFLNRQCPRLKHLDLSKCYNIVFIGENESEADIAEAQWTTDEDEDEDEDEDGVESEAHNGAA